MSTKYIRFDSKQELFDHVVLCLAAQDWRRAMSRDEGICAYRGVNDDKCAVGHCIPDDLYRASFEGGTIHDDGDEEKYLGEESPKAKQIREAAGIPVKLRQFAKQMQRLHDTHYGMEYQKHLNVDMKQKFIVLGMAHALSLRVFTD